MPWLQTLRRLQAMRRQRAAQELHTLRRSLAWAVAALVAVWASDGALARWVDDSTLRGHLGTAKDAVLLVAVVAIAGRELSRRADALSAQAATLQGLLEQPWVGLATLDARTAHWRRVNPQLCTLLGVSRDELLERPWSEWLHPDDRDADRAAFADLARGLIERHRATMRLVRRDRTIVQVDVDVRLVPGAGQQPDALIASVLERPPPKVAPRAIALAESHRRAATTA